MHTLDCVDVKYHCLDYVLRIHGLIGIRLLLYVQCNIICNIINCLNICNNPSTSSGVVSFYLSLRLTSDIGARMDFQ